MGTENMVYPTEMDIDTPVTAGPEADGTDDKVVLQRDIGLLSAIGLIMSNVIGLTICRT